MRSHPMLGTLLILGACGGGRFYSTLTASPATSPAEVMDCTRAQLRSLGYSMTSYDEVDFRMTARKADNDVKRPDPQFRRNLDRLEIQAAPGSDGKTTLTVTAHTFAEFETHRGPTEEEERASAGARQSAQAIVDSCGHT